MRVAVDGPPGSDPVGLARALVEPLRLRGRPAAVVDARAFWRDASLRLEYGRRDVESFAAWLDDAALRREVLGPVAVSGEYLPSLRDPRTNRSTRADRRRLGDSGVLVVAGALLLGRDLPFDRCVHLAVSPAARARRVDADQAWTLPAFDRYDRDVRPAELADVVIRCDDPAHPAMGWPR